MTLHEFRDALLEAGSNASIWANENLLNGVQGMPITHQVGFGHYLRKGIHPNDVNIDRMNDEVHLRMLATVASITATAPAFSSQNVLLNILGGVTAAYSTYQLVEFYNDWKAGFQAEQLLGDHYWGRMNKKTIGQGGRLRFTTLID